MKKYTLEIIPGTERWVEEELELKHPSVEIGSRAKGELILESDEDIDLFKDILSGIRITKEGEKNALNLYRRNWRKEFVPAGINPALAYVMCRIAEINYNDVVLDPFCGGGTIPITASLYFNPKQVIASDISGRAIDVTENNIKSAHLCHSDRHHASGERRNPLNSNAKSTSNSLNTMVFRSDVSKLRLGKESITKVITNLPFGIRERSHDKNIIIYENFAKKINSALKVDGKAVILTQEIKLIQEIFKKHGFKKIFDQPIEQGGLKPHIFVFIPSLSFRPPPR